MSQSSPLRGALQSLRDKPDELIEIILRQAEAIEKFTQRIEQLEQQIKDLKAAQIFFCKIFEHQTEGWVWCSMLR